MSRRDPKDLALTKGLPVNVDAERLILGSILVDDAIMGRLLSELRIEHFALETHQTIYRRMAEIHEREERVDRVTIANELMRFGELESIGGLSYLVSLDDGMPKLANLDGYVRIIRDKADLRMLIAIGQGLTNGALMAEETPNKICEASQRQLGDLIAGMLTAQRSWNFEQVVEQRGLNDFLAAKNEGIPTGFNRLDKLTYGLEPCLLYVIGADSSHGKSALASNMAKNVALGTMGDDWKVSPQPAAIFSLEMSKEAIFRRILCGVAKVSSYRVKKGYIDKEERMRLQLAASELVNAPLYVDDSPGLGVHEFCNRVRVMKRQHGIKVAFLDYLQLINWRADGFKSEYEGVTFTTWALHQLAKSEKIAVVLLTQFHQEYSRRKDKNQRPTLDSCHGSGSIKKDADVGILIYKRAAALPGVSEEKNRVELIVTKHREGPIGTVLADFKPSWTTFMECPDELQPEKDTGE